MNRVAIAAIPSEEKDRANKVRCGHYTSLEAFQRTSTNTFLYDDPRSAESHLLVDVRVVVSRNMKGWA